VDGTERFLSAADLIADRVGRGRLPLPVRRHGGSVKLAGERVSAESFARRRLAATATGQLRK
jgi:hypothetical protein